MISIRRLGLAFFLALSFSVCSNAQTNADGTETTSNLITDTWNNVSNGTLPGDCCSGGPAPLYDSSTNTIHFSYGLTAVHQVQAINQALSGSGIQINGWNWAYDLRNMNGGGGQNGTDSIAVTSFITNSAGQIVQQSDQHYNTQFEWTRYSGTETLNSPLADYGSLGIQFVAKDDGYWAGYYGPQVRNVSLAARYTAGPDPCVTDPLSSTSCPGYAEAYKSQQCSIDPLYDTSCPGYAQAYFNNQCMLNPLYDNTCPGNSTVVTGPNITSGTSPVNLSTALSHSGAGLTVYGFNYGFDWRRGSGKCYNEFLFWCTDWRTYSSVKPNLHITDGDGTALINRTWNFSGDGAASGSVNETTIFYGTSYNSLNLGTADWDANVSNVGSVRNYFLRPLIAPDQCAVDPLSNTSCTGYAAAFLAFQCSISSLYSPECPGYTIALQAMLDEQAALAAAATPTVDPVATVAAASTTSPATADDSTKNQTEVTTDVGGAELSTTGEVVVSDGIPSDVKESVKESIAVVEKKEETKNTESVASSPSSPAKKTTKVNVVAIAQNAIREAEKVALVAANEAVSMSLSNNANPDDGIGIGSLGSGIAIPGLRVLQGLGNDISSSQVDGQAIRNTSVNRNKDTEKTEESQTAANDKQSNTTTSDLQAAMSVPTVPPEPVAPKGPAVRRGGAVEGMEGGADMNQLAKAPMDFNQYITMQMQDSAFYASKEIYPGQKNVDNARVLRGLGTDRLHQQMVDQQYNILGQ